MNLNNLGSLLTEASELSTDVFDMEPLAISNHHHHHHASPDHAPLPKPSTAAAPPVIKDHQVIAADNEETEKPKRPLSAYNIFFRYERNRIINPESAEAEVYPLTVDSIKLDTSRVRKKRLHRKTHGKIGFAQLARTIADKWKSLDPASRKVFEACAAKEKQRYAKEMSEWKAQRDLRRIKHDARMLDLEPEPIDSTPEPYYFSTGNTYGGPSQTQTQSQSQSYSHSRHGSDNGDDYFRMTEATLDMARASLSLPLFSGGQAGRRHSNFEPTSLQQIANTSTQSASELSRQFREMLHSNSQAQSSSSSARTFKTPQEEAFYRHYFG
jgi:hypothetical protein